MSTAACSLVGVMLVAAASIAIAATARSDNAGSYPTRPVRIIVGSAPGGGADLTARIVAQKLTDTWGRSVIVENRSGTALYALEATANATADGYTTGMGTFNAYLLAVLSPDLRFNLVKDIEPITQFTSQAYLLVVHPSIPGATLKDLVAYVKTRPGKLNYASSGTGGAAHLGMELLRGTTGMDVVHISYRGSGPAVIDLMAGQVQMMFGSAPSVAPHVRSGKLKAIAVTTARRSKYFPELPTIAESGARGFELNGWYGLVAPAAVRPSVVRTLHESIKQALADPAVHARFAADGSEVETSDTPAAFKKLVNGEIVKWQKYARTSGFKAHQ